MKRLQNQDTEEDTGRWNDPPHSWIRRINTAKVAIHPWAISRFKTILIKSVGSFFTNKKSPKSYKGTQKTKYSQSNPEQKACCSRYVSPDFKLTAEPQIEKQQQQNNFMVLAKKKNGYIHQENRTEEQDISPYNYNYLSFDNDAKNMD